jgi:hypothetical protein
VRIAVIGAGAVGSPSTPRRSGRRHGWRRRAPPGPASTSLKTPDKRVRIDVVGAAVALSLPEPGEVFSIYAFDVAQTEPAAAG